MGRWKVIIPWGGIDASIVQKLRGLNPNPMIYPGALDIPLKAGFQLLKLVKQEDCARVGRKCILFNGLSDKAKSRWMNSMNQSTEGN